MKCFLLFITILTNVSLYSQSKGVTESTPSPQSGEGRGEVYAVVIGISDYQDPGIPDLRFAEKDAEAFANYLRSSAGGNLDHDHLKLLLNKEATVAQFAIALDWLMEVVKENDQVILYFSGHGDVEKKTITQPGYLLCWDAPARVYLAGGALALPMFQDIITTLSSQNKAKVVVITDACRSGKLAGSSVGGSQITGANLAKQYANEIKILSCQPNEYSIEGEQWGGGRGVFSYHLVNALYGMADHNNDQLVNLHEASRYLEDHVSKEVAPVSQMPMILGNRMELLAHVDASLLASVKSSKSHQLALLSSIESRGMEEDILSSVDTSIRLNYKLFNKALKEKKFIEPESNCAEYYYQHLMAHAGLSRLHSTMTRNYAAALQDDAQQVMNIMLKSGLTEQVLKNTSFSKLFKSYPAYLERASELLGKGHYMYQILQARKYYFEGLMKTSRKEARTLFRKALELQPDMPHAMIQLVRMSEGNQLDSALYYFEKGKNLVPQWVEPYLSMSKFYEWRTKQTDKAEEILILAGKLDSTSVLVKYKKADFYYTQGKFELAEQFFLSVIESIQGDICFPCAYHNLGNVYFNTQRYDLAEIQYHKAIQIDSTFSPAYFGLGNVYRSTLRYNLMEKCLEKAILLDSNSVIVNNSLGILYLDTHRYDLAVAKLLKIIQLDSGFVHAYYNLGRTYKMSKRDDLAEKYYKKTIELDITYWEAFFDLGYLYLNSKRLVEAEQMFYKVLEIVPNDFTAYYNLACISGIQGKIDQAYEHLAHTLKMGYKDFDTMHNDKDLILLRQRTQQWNSLMKKYFPDKMKN
ncbi:MAG: tetratricopeptide repeat protein [Saprospiraceae bacterium]|nr:tetratricopeptide repeat protein [Saprospiraceae bacterium]